MSESVAFLANVVSHIWDAIRFIGVMLMGIIMWKGNIAQAMNDVHAGVTNGLKHTTDAAGVGVGAVAIGDAAGVINWFDLISDTLQLGIIFLTFVWMTYRIIEIRVNIRLAREKLEDD